MKTLIAPAQPDTSKIVGDFVALVRRCTPQRGVIQPSQDSFTTEDFEILRLLLIRAGFKPTKIRQGDAIAYVETNKTDCTGINKDFSPNANIPVWDEHSYIGSFSWVPTEWLNSAVKLVIQDPESAESLILSEIAGRKAEPVIIQLSAHGDTLSTPNGVPTRELPAFGTGYLGLGSRMPEKGYCGIHNEQCGGSFKRKGRTATKDVLLCGECGAFFLIPVNLGTYGALEIYFDEFRE